MYIYTFIIKMHQQRFLFIIGGLDPGCEKALLPAVSDSVLNRNYSVGKLSCFGSLSIAPIFMK